MSNTTRNVSLDTIVNSAVMLTIAVAILAVSFGSNAVNAEAPMAHETMETIVITAPRMPHETMNTIVVTAKRLG